MTHNGDTGLRNISTATRNWDSAIDFGNSSNTYKLVRALLSQAERIDDDVSSVYHDHHIDSAEGEVLEQFGKLVNAPRKENEPDDKYRTRIKAEFAQARTDTDFDSFVQFCTSVLNTDISNLEFGTNYEGNPATVVISADPNIYERRSLTAEELTELLGGGIPAGHEVRIQELGTFRLKEDGDTDDPDKGLTSDSISTGGTLAGDII